MGRVMQPNPKPTFSSGKANIVQKVAPAQLCAVAWVDGEGRESTCLAITFGKDVEDGGPGVFILADEQAMRDQLVLANNTIKKGVRQWLAQQTANDGDVPTGDVPTGDEAVGDIDLATFDLSSTPEKK